MPVSRRAFFRWSALALGAAVGGPVLGGPGRLSGRPWILEPEDDDPGEDVKKVLRERFGDRPIRPGHVDLTLPEAPPDGRTVPVFIESDLPMATGDYVEALHLIVDKNPDIYLAGFRFTPAIGRASIDTRIKLRATTHVRAIAETSRGELWSRVLKVYPLSNGCG